MSTLTHSTSNSCIVPIMVSHFSSCPGPRTSDPSSIPSLTSHSQSIRKIRSNPHPKIYLKIQQLLTMTSVTALVHDTNSSWLNHFKNPPPPTCFPNLYPVLLSLFSTQQKQKQTKLYFSLKKKKWGFPGGAVVRNPPANAGDMGSTPGPGRSHMRQNN